PVTAIHAGIPLSPPIDRATCPDPLRRDASARRVLAIAWVMAALISLGLVGLFARVAQLQLRTPEPIARLIDSQHSTITVLGRRGTLLDRTGRQLAVTGVQHNLWVDPRLINDPNFPERVGYTFGIDPAQIARTMSERPDKRYILLARSTRED